MSLDTIFFNGSAFVSGLFLLEFGFKCFINNTRVIALQLGASETLVTLLTAGAEWKELAVVIACLLQDRTSLAVGNILGSSISNILGVFSLGLLFHPREVEFDGSAKVYATVLFVFTSTITVLGLIGLHQRAIGLILAIAFGIYMASVRHAISRGTMEPPEVLNNDGDDNANSSDADSDVMILPSEESALLPPPAISTTKPVKVPSLPHHSTQLIIGLFALSISGFVLSHTAASLADELHLSSTLIGATILGFGMTLSAKLMAILTDSPEHDRIIIANTAGSNIFLLTLCLGITIVTGNQDELARSLEPLELVVMLMAAALLLLIVFMGATRWVGGVLMGLYWGFVVLEFTVYKR